MVLFHQKEKRGEFNAVAKVFVRNGCEEDGLAKLYIYYTILYICTVYLYILYHN